MKIKTAKPVSSVIYNGPSLIDNQPIIVVAIISSKNSKTGNLIQTHILRSDVSPLEASKTGMDASICGDCIHRGTPTDNPLKKTAKGRTCYVNIGQGPTQVFKAFKAGKYPSATNEQITSIGRDRMIRLGTYGDPAAVPDYVWTLLLKDATGWTGYTHQHKAKQSPDYSRMMYSADTMQDAQNAHNKGYRTFRVIPVKIYIEQGKASMLSNEILCPASKEAGQRVTCLDCRLCTGSQSKAKSIAIVAHGVARNNVKG